MDLFSSLLSTTLISTCLLFGEFIEELGRSRVPMVNMELAKRKGKKKMNKKGVDVRFFFSGLAVFKFGTKVVILLMNAFCPNIT